MFKKQAISGTTDNNGAATLKLGPFGYSQHFLGYVVCQAGTNQQATYVLQDSAGNALGGFTGQLAAIGTILLGPGEYANLIISQGPVTAKVTGFVVGDLQYNAADLIPVPIATPGTAAVATSGSSSTTDVTDRAARLLGHITIDNPLGQKAMASSLPVAWASDQSALPAGTNRIGSMRPVDSSDADLTSAKASQTSRALGVQELKDAGRAQVMLSWEEMAGTAAAESALTNFTFGTLAAANLTAATFYTVSAGKTLRIQSVTIYLKSTSTVAILARYRIRQAASAIANSSPIIFDAVLNLPSATFATGEGDQMPIPIPDGLEVSAGQEITFTWFTSVNTCSVGMSITGYEY